jgi:hypothetical protein
MRHATALLAVLLGLAGSVGLNPLTVQAAELPAATRQIDLEELATDLTGKTMQVFVEAIRKGDFADLRDMASERFKAAYTVADISQAFQSFGATIVTGDPLADAMPVFLEPPAMKDGLLAVQGLYELPDGLLLFDLAFAPEAGDWKLDGIDVRSQPIEGPSTSAATAE